MPVLAIVFRTYPLTVVGIAFVSGLVNILYLTGSFFMLEVYDRVIPSRSLPTLLGLMALAAGLFVLQGLLEILRSRVFVRLAEAFETTVARPVFEAMNRSTARGSPDGVQALRDLEQVRSYLAGGGPSAIFDLPWIPLYVGICYSFHPLIGAMAVAGCVTLALLTLLADLSARSPSRALAHHAGVRNTLAETGRRNAQTLAAMGMTAAHAERWQEANRAYVRAVGRSLDRNGGFSTLSKVFRTALQSGVLAVGAWLVIEGNATGGVMIAASILVSRALAPAEQVIAHWRGLVGAREGWARLQTLLMRAPAPAEPLALPAPTRSLSVRCISVIAPGATCLTVQDVNFELVAGQAMGVIGPSASGKSTLGRALLKVWPCARGSVRLDGAALDQWSETTLGPHVGYLAQEAELLSGTVGQNVARFDPRAEPGAVIAAAKAAGAHEMILDLPKGYDTPVGEDGTALSAGQRQRVGLARALYGAPFLVVLDEPNANLDAEGEAALTQAILGVRGRGGICIVIAHRPSVLVAVDTVLLMAEGRMKAVGPRDEVLKHVLKPVAVPDDARAGPIGVPVVNEGREVA